VSPFHLVFPQSSTRVLHFPFAPTRFLVHLTRDRNHAPGHADRRGRHLLCDAAGRHREGRLLASASRRWPQSQDLRWSAQPG